MRIIEVNNPEQIMFAKHELEALHGDMPVQNLQTFINTLNMQNNIFIKDDIVVPFSIVSDMLFVVADNDNIKLLTGVLEQLNYKLNTLIEIPTLDVYNGKLEKYEFYFIINSKYMVLEK